MEDYCKENVEMARSKKNIGKRKELIEDKAIWWRNFNQRSKKFLPREVSLLNRLLHSL